MYKLLIVDDEQLERRALRQIIQQNLTLIEVVGEARNGTEAVELAVTVKPDIILMDIKMPEKSGVEASEEIRNLLPKSKIIILSAYDHFDYARAAVKFSATEYLLKPVRPQLLLKTLNSIIETLEEEKRREEEEELLRRQLTTFLPAIKNGFLLDLIYGEISDIHEIKKKAEFLKLKVVPATVFLIDISDIDKKNAQISEVKRQFLRQQIITRLEEKIEGTLVTVAFLGNHRFALLYGNEELPEFVKEADLALAEKIMDILSRTYSIYVAVGIGKRYPSIMEISQSYIEAERALICKKGNINQIIHVTDISEDRPTLFFSAFEKKQLMKAIFDHEKQEAINKMKGFFAQGQNYSSLTEMKLFLLQFFLSDVDERLSRGFSNKMENLQQIVQLAECDSIEELERLTLKQIDVIFEEMHQMKDFFNRKLINKALNYIHENLEKNLTLEEVANLIYLSPYYFSRQFKIMTKMNFIRYVTNVRIEKSKELLSKTDWNITKIALKTGFQNANYFCKVFKKITGYTPGDWRIKNGLK